MRNLASSTPGVAGAVLLAGALISTGSCAKTPGPKPPKRVLLAILDTVRADHLSCYGYPRPTTPHLDRLAGEGERYDDALAQSSWTLPAIATILTGRPPHDHGADFRGGLIYPVRRNVPTLAELLRDRGFRTAGIFNVVWVRPQSGLKRGFDVYDHFTTDPSNRNHRSAGETTDLALRWLKRLDPDDSFFLAVHYFDPHLTYDPPAPFDEQFLPEDAERIPRDFGSAEQVAEIRTGALRLSWGQQRGLIARYDGELRYVDEEFGRLRAGMENLGLWNNTLVVAVADHGEEFWDHDGFEHGHSHHREVIRVPLIVRRPGGPAGVVRPGRVRQLDIVPTILEHAGVPTPEGLPGRPLGADSNARTSIAEGTLWGEDLVSVRSDNGVLILGRESGRAVHFGADDPTEWRPLPVEAAERAGLLGILRSLPPPRGSGEPAWRPTEEQLRQLRSLGYVQ